MSLSGHKGHRETKEALSLSSERDQRPTVVADAPTEVAVASTEIAVGPNEVRIWTL